MPKPKYKDAGFAFAYILPSFLLILVFSIIPIIMDVGLSFTSYNMITSPEWTGLDNYKRLFTDPYIGASIKNTVIFTFVTVPVQTLLALVFAAVIADKFRSHFGEAVKSAMFIPVIASMVLIGNLWTIILEPHGIVNNFLGLFGISPVNWLGSKHLSLFSVCIISIWKNVGYFLVIFYAGIMGIPAELYDAADVDGAGTMQKFLHITVPALSSVTYLVVTLGTIWSFQVFDLVYTLTGGGPGLSTQTLVLTIYNTAFRSYEMGYASTIALLMFVFVLVISILQKKFLAKED